MKIIINAAIQYPWQFPAGIQTESGNLLAGDYSIKGLETICAIRQKSLSGLVECLAGDSREMFKKEMMLLKAMRCRAVIVEGSMHDIMIHRYLSRMEPESVIGSLASWQTKYDMHFIFAGDGEGAARYALALFRTFHNQCKEFSKQFKIED